MLWGLKMKHGIHLWCQSLFRGKFSICEAEEALCKLKSSGSHQFKEWIARAIGK